MIHPIFKVALRRPGLVVEHLGNYVALLRESAGDIAHGLVMKAVAWAVAGLCLVLALGFTGVSVILGVFTGRFHWVLVIVPAVPLVAALVALVLAMRAVVKNEVDDLSAQINADKDALDAVRGA